MRGVESVPVDQDYAAADKALLAHCPNVKVVGTVVGDFNVPAAKTAVQEFLGLASRQDHAVIQHGAMGAGVISAFQQAGRPVPPVPLISAAAGELGYWAQNAGKGYKTAADLTDGVAYAKLGWNVMMRVLGGKQPKTADISSIAPLVTPAQLSQYAKDPLTDTGEPNETDQMISNSYLNNFFKVPGAVTSPKDVVSK